MLELWWLAAEVFLASLFLTWFIGRAAVQLGMIDRPNERSSHSEATPRGGGLAIVLTAIGGTLMLVYLGIVDRQLALALLGALPVAVVGFIDDRKSLPATVRFMSHTAAAVWSVWMLGGLPPLQVGDDIVDLGLWGDFLAVLATVWTLNLFNFMDGIDGIAAAQAVFVCWGGAILTLALGAAWSVPAVAMLLGAACCGFLWWNWSPARIFMGDIGSGFLGFAIAVLAIAASRDAPIAAVIWLILGAVFFTDATVTLARRVARGDKPSQAHRTHAYQWLARRWGHQPVAVSMIICNLLFVLPCALLAVAHVSIAWWILAVVLVILAATMLIAGAGRPEEKTMVE